MSSGREGKSDEEDAFPGRLSMKDRMSAFGSSEGSEADILVELESKTRRSKGQLKVRHHVILD
jgi:hypothetical protein